MAYRNNSAWNELNEIRCLLIFKILRAENFPKQKQNKLCQEMASITDLKATSINAKVSNYKSVAGINNPSNASSNTIEIYKKYSNLSIAELELLIKQRER
ncbi:hypothetical protein J1N51_11465 [Psychrosphaera ytuae]|uniref:Uncharacterized protein n=1 Tax=Psychrosphaera ytuae TaxID=2820710 RepID=A0A975HJL2_9GAMM|nr:hypothetical protein [Psychrosphaera ytuae]QTH63344.1 hypothetical protein J1N51_11465 [Psychrosphaera ytuae]